MKPKYKFFNKIELDDEHKFYLIFEKYFNIYSMIYSDN